MAISENSVTSLARLTFGSPIESDDLQDFGANLIEISRINSSLRLIDPNSESFNPSLLASHWFYRNRLYRQLNRNERLYIVRANKSSPTWIEIGFLSSGFGAIVYAVHAFIMLIADQGRITWQQDNMKNVISAYLRTQFPEIEEGDVYRAATHITGSLLSLTQSESPLIAIDSLLEKPEQREEVVRIFHELNSKKQLQGRR